MTTPPFDLHKACYLLAQDYVGNHIDKDEDNEDCFNLVTYLEDVESRLITVLEHDGSRTANFQLDYTALARYLWCCLALDSGDDPGGTTFRGMPILG